MSNDRRDDATEKGQHIASGPRLRPARVLIIDDEPFVASALARLLSDESEVVVEARAQDALERLVEGERYDLVLCDLMMPGMNGMELYERLHSEVPEEALRIVFITGGVYLPKIRAFLDTVPNTCLEKPIDLPGLRELIQRRVRSVREVITSNA